MWCERTQKAIVTAKQNHKGILVHDVHGTQNCDLLHQGTKVA